MTTPNGAGSPPAGGRSYEQVYELATVTPPAQANPDLWNNAETARSRFNLNILSGFLSLGAGLGQLLSDLAKALFGIGGSYTGSNPELIEIQDGQLALNERFDLVTENAGHGAAYMTKNYWMGTNGGGALGGRGKEIPFRAYLGPHKNCELVIGADGSEDTGHWRLLAPGTWRADLHVTANSSSVRSELIIEVCAPDGTAWHRKLLAKPGSGSDEVSEVMATKFVVPASGYTVHARRTKVVNPVKHRLQGGTERSAFILTREDIDTTDHANEPTVPDGPDIG